MTETDPRLWIVLFCVVALTPVWVIVVGSLFEPLLWGRHRETTSSFSEDREKYRVYEER